MLLSWKHQMLKYKSFYKESNIQWCFYSYFYVVLLKNLCCFVQKMSNCLCHNWFKWKWKLWRCFFLWKLTFTFLLLTSYKNDHLLQKCIFLRYFSSKGEQLYNWLINCGWVTPPVNLCKKLTFQVWNLHVCFPSFDLEESWEQLIQKIKWQGLYQGRFVLYANHAINSTVSE